jgi:FlaA1/EpsC-like NDP-sugar epimerase
MVIISGAYFLAYWLALEVRSHDFGVYMPTFTNTLPWLLAIRFLCAILVRQYTWAFHQASLSEAAGIAKATIVGSFIFVVFCRYGSFLPFGIPQPPRSTYVLELLLSLSAMEFIRFFPRYIYQAYLKKTTHIAANGESKLRTLIYGAGDTGALILRDLLRTRIYPYIPVGFIDDSASKWNTSIQGVRVFGGIDDLHDIISKHKIDKLLIAADDIKPSKLRKIVDICSDSHVKFKMVPNYAELVAKGDAGPIVLKDVQLEDLLERTPVTFDHTTMAEFFVDKTVLITGAAGSIGSEICRQAGSQGIRRLIAFDMNENDLYFLKLDLEDLCPAVKTHIEIGSIQDKGRLEDVFAKYNPEIVFHAAAHKHVPLIEFCPSEGLKNNILGTKNVAECADKFSSERFVLISTDKAVKPTNIMGACKCLAEYFIRDINKRSKTRFMAVRFGNVLGSNGSLVHILKRQIAKGGPVTITHPKITRFFMTIPEAVGLVLLASVQSDGEICVLDMGEPLSVDRLAREMISLMGLIPDKDIKIVYTGLRPGEKMYEELFAHTESHTPSSHPRINIATGDDLNFEISNMLTDLDKSLESSSEEAIPEFIKKYVPGFKPDPRLEADKKSSARFFHQKNEEENNR